MGSARLSKDPLAKTEPSFAEIFSGPSRCFERKFIIVLSYRIRIGHREEGRPQISLHGKLDGWILRSSWATDPVS